MGYTKPQKLVLGLKGHIGHKKKHLIWKRIFTPEKKVHNTFHKNEKMDW